MVIVKCSPTLIGNIYIFILIPVIDGYMSNVFGLQMGPGSLGNKNGYVVYSTLLTHTKQFENVII